MPSITDSSATPVAAYSVPPSHPNEASRQFPPVLDSTIVELWRACRFKCYVRHFLGLERVGATSRHLTFGGAVAKGLEVTRRAFYGDGLAPQHSIPLGTEALLRYWHNEPATLESGPPSVRAKTLDAALCAHALYFERWPLGQDELVPIRTASGAPAVEVVTAVKIPGVPRHPVTGQELLYALRADMVARIADLPWVVAVDEKTTTKFGASYGSQFATRGQFLGYIWGLQQLGLPCKGLFARSIRVTKSEEIEFAEHPIMPTPATLERWLADLKSTVHDMVAAWHQNYFPHNWGSSCGAYGGCDYVNVCSSGEPLTWVGPPGHEVRRWNPLETRE